MKNFLLIAALMMASLIQTRAQAVAAPIATSETEPHGKSPAGLAAKNADWAEKQLGLDADQKSKWREATLARIAANTPLHEKIKTTTTESERRDLFREIRKNGKKFDETVNGFLTADQKVKWAEIKQARKSTRKNRKHHSSAQPEPAKQD
jgi:hypothetical protein